MEPGLLIAIFTVIFLVTGRYIWKRDVLFGVVYFFLFIYTVFAQIGYAYFPELSMFIQAYFGPEIFYDVNLFVTLSFIAFFLCFLFLHRYVVRKPAYVIVQSRPRLSMLFYMVVICHLFSMALYFFANYDSISYITSSDEDYRTQAGLANTLFGMGFKLSVAVNLLLYFLYRVRMKTAPSINHFAILSLLILEIVLFVAISVKLGSRTDPLALTIAIAVLEILLGREQGRFVPLNKWKWAKILLLIGGVLYGLIQIEKIRNPDAVAVESMAELILLKDYYAPSHILIAAMALDYVEPGEVLVSNSANALILLKQPYLQTTVADLFNPGVSSRSASYAFYLFSEGYIAMGWLGFLYNGLVVFAGVALWRRLANSNSSYYNLFMISLVATQAANIARSQSSYFVKDIYMFFIPAMLLFFLATGLRPWLGRKAQRYKSRAKS